jgi:hypothetical protein
MYVFLPDKVLECVRGHIGQVGGDNLPGGTEEAHEKPEWSRRFSDANFNATLKTRVF